MDATDWLPMVLEMSNPSIRRGANVQSYKPLEFFDGLPPDFFVSQVIGDSSGGVLFRQKEQLVFDAPLGRHDADGVPAFA